MPAQKKGRKPKIPDNLVPTVLSMLETGVSAAKIKKQLGLEVSNQTIYNLRKQPKAKRKGATQVPSEEGTPRDRLLDQIRSIVGKDVLTFEIVVVLRWN